MVQETQEKETWETEAEGKLDEYMHAGSIADAERLPHFPFIAQFPQSGSPL